MSLNKSAGNMYKFITDTWNPLIGKCLHKCSYCSTNKFYYPKLIERYSGPIRVDEKCLKDNLGSGNYIFVVAQNDLFADGVPDEMVQRIIDHCKKYPGNKYLFQTKNPSRINDSILPENSVVCTTIETNRHYKSNLMEDCPPPLIRALGMYCINLPKYLTIEPIIRFDLQPMLEIIRQVNPVQINIGADSGGNNLPEPCKKDILNLIDSIPSNIIVEQKSNLKRLLK